MNQILQFLIFIFIFISIYFGMHFYLFYRLGGLLGIKRNLAFYLVMFVFIISFILSTVLERKFNNIITQILYSVSATWFGVLFLLISTLIVYEILNIFVKIKPYYAGIGIIVFVGIITIFSIVNALSTNIRTVDVSIPNLKEDIDIVHLSDIHIGTINNEKFIRKIVKMTNDLNPELVLITGDLFDSSGTAEGKLVSPLKDLKAKTYFSLGNHEWYEGVDEVIPIMDEQGIKTLRSEVVEYKGIQIAGLDDPGNRRRSEIPYPEFKINKSKPAILMYHQPNRIKEASEAGFNLQLSGHTHNGQIFPFTLLVKLFYPRINGLYEAEGMYLYVSPGTGTWGPPMRFGSKSEITLIRLKKT